MSRLLLRFSLMYVRNLKTYFECFWKSMIRVSETPMDELPHPDHQGVKQLITTNGYIYNENQYAHLQHL